jgi:hypothetical protein
VFECIRWSSVTGKIYRVDSGTNLMEGFTVNVRSNIPATPVVNTLTVRLDRANQEYFRVQIEP